MKKIILLTSFLVISPLCAMQPNEPRTTRTTQSIIKKELIVKQLPAEYQNKPVVWLQPLILQADGCSCGDRSIFHALSVFYTMKGLSAHKPLVPQLFATLGSLKLFVDVQTRVAKIVPASIPLDSHLLTTILSTYFPELKDRTIMLTKYLNGVAIPDLTPDAIHHEVPRLMQFLNNAYESIFFICNVGYHVILIAAVTDSKKHAILYVIDSMEQTDVKKIKPFLDLLLMHVQSHNSCH